MRRSIVLQTAIVLFAVAILMAAGAPGIPAAARAPGLRLISPLTHVDVTRFPGDTDLFVPASVYVTPTSGSFVIDVTSAPDGSVTLWQVRRDGRTVHRIRQIHPAGQVNMFDGLPTFFHAELLDAGGAVVSQRDVQFCPSSGFSNARVDTSGPIRPSFPYYCGTALTRATVWGLDQGWATTFDLTMPNPSDAPDGDYTLTVGIASSYAQQLDITSRPVLLAMTITTGSTPGPCPPEIVCTATTRSSNTASTELAPVASSEERRHGGDGLHGGGLPDLAALPAHDLTIEDNADDGHDYLDFAATIWNGGTGPFVVEGFRSGSAPLMTAKQFIFRNGAPVRSATIGQFEFDTRPGHNHWHMEDVAQYDLLDARRNRVVLSEKQSFCLAPTDPIDLTATGADWQPDRAGLWSSCAGEGSIWLRETLPAGWGDTYFQSVAGQSFDVTNIPNGRYFVRVTADPFHRMLESSYTNNASFLAVDLGGAPGARTVDVA